MENVNIRSKGEERIKVRRNLFIFIAYYWQYFYLQFVKVIMVLILLNNSYILDFAEVFIRKITVYQNFATVR